MSLIDVLFLLSFQIKTQIQYADGTFFICIGKTTSESKLNLEKSIAKLIIFYKKNELNVNLKIKHEILAVENLIKYRVIIYFIYSKSRFTSFR